MSTVMMDTAAMRALLARATNGGNWRLRVGHPADHFQPDGYRYVQFGPTEKAANGYGTDQLAPADAELIVAAVALVRAVVSEPETCPKCGLPILDAGHEDRHEALRTERRTETPRERAAREKRDGAVSDQELTAEALIVFAMHVAWIVRTEGRYPGNPARDARKFAREYITLASPADGCLQCEAGNDKHDGPHLFAEAVS